LRASLAIEGINARGGIKIARRSEGERHLRRCRRQHRKSHNAAQGLVADNPYLVGETQVAVTEVTERAQIPWFTLNYSDAVTNRGF
jgi:branched-chain amino acid transport system substrate-binding protein